MIDKQSLISILLSVLACLLIFISLSQEFLSITTYNISTSGITNSIAYEDVTGKVYTSFESFESFACRKSRNENILTLCGNILSFEISGIILKVSSYLSILLTTFILYSFYFKLKTFKYFQLLPSLLYFIGSTIYLALVSKDVKSPSDESIQVTYEFGCFVIFTVNIINIANCGHYLYNSRHEDFAFHNFQEHPEENLIELPQPNGLKDLKNNESLSRLNKCKELLEILEKEKNSKNSEMIAEALANIKSALEGFEKAEQDNDIENTRRFAEHNRVKSEQELNLMDRVEKLQKENRDLRTELNRSAAIGEFRNEEKNLLESTKALLNEKRAKIEELEKAKKLSEVREKNAADSIAELKKYLKEYEEILIQIKRDKDDALKKLKIKESDLELLNGKLTIANAESAALKASLSPSPGLKQSVSEIEIESLNAQISLLSDLLKKSKDQNSELTDKNSEVFKELENMDGNFKNVMQEYQLSINKIYELEAIINEYPEVKSKHNKALDEIHDFSTVFESFKKEPNESRMLADDKSINVDKLLKKKEKIAKLKKSERSLNKNLEKHKKKLESSDIQLSELKTELEQAKNKENEGFKLLRLAEEEFERVKTELVYTNSQQTREIETLQSRMKSQEDFFENELQSTQLALESLKDELKKDKMQQELLKLDYQRIKRIEEILENSAPEDVEGLIKESSKKSGDLLTDAFSKIEKIISEKEKLRKKLIDTEAELQIISAECQNLHKSRFESRKDETISMSSIESSSRSIQDSLIIEGISPSIIFHNPLIDRLSSMRKEPPMSYSTMWKLLETMMLEKLKADKLDIDIGRNPRNPADYMFEFMQKQYGLKTLGLKQLKALINSLEELYRIQHPYAVFFCRVLGIFHPRPIPLKVSTFLFALQELFLTVSKKANPRENSFPDLYDIQQFGGEASILDVLNLIKSAFRANRAAGERILSTLHQDQPDHLELTILKICGTLKSLGKTDSDLFKFFHKDPVDYQEFIDGVREGWEIWVSQEDAEGLCAFLDEESKGEVSRSVWDKKIRFEEFCGKIETKAALVTKADFLNSLVCEYEYEALEDYHELKKIIKAGPLGPEEVSRHLVQISPDLTLESQERLFKEALVHDGGKGREVSHEALCIVILKHNIGGYGRGVFRLETLKPE